MVEIKSRQVQIAFGSCASSLVHTSHISLFRKTFSVAGLTIAKDRARMAPQTANELIVLHDAIPTIRKYIQSCEG
jgi:hypothetical protein